MSQKVDVVPEGARNTPEEARMPVPEVARGKKKELSMTKVAKLIDLSYAKDKKSTKRFKVDKKYTNDKHTVVNDRKTGRKAIIFKGTNPTDLRDIRSDLALAVGQQKRDTRFKNSKSITEKVRKASKREGRGSKLTVIGHSLGGSLAEYSGKKKDKIITVNKGAGIDQIGKRIGKNQTDYRSKYDAVSALSLLNKGPKKKSTGNRSLRQLGDKGAHSYKSLKKK